MDKNMINIDELVRQRLSGAEDRERTGAWANMRQMLDDKMPVRTPVAGYNWRRLFSAATVLVLLATVTAGSYHVYNTRFNNKSAAVAANSPFTKAQPGTSGNVGGAIANSSRSTTIHNQSISNNATGYSENNNDRRLTADNTGDSKAAGIAFSGNGKSTLNHTSPVKNNIDLRKNSESNNDRNRLNNNPAELPDSRSVSDDNTASKDKSIAAGNEKQHGTPGLQTSPLSNPLTGANSRSGKNESLKDNANTPNSGNGTIASGKPEVKKTPLQKDTFRQLTVRERFVANPHTMRGYVIVDTIASGKIVMDKQLIRDLADRPLAMAKEQQPSPTVNPAASFNAKDHAAGAETNFLVPLSSLKVRSQQTNAWNTRSFNEVVRDVKFNLSQIKFYPGVILGFNSYVMGSNNINGLHLGVTGTFTFGDHWNMMAEFKYMHRFNNGSSIHDNYSRIIDSSYNANNEKTYLQSKVEHFFKFSTMQSIEMPIAVRYAAGRVNLFGGVNMAYNFRVNVEEVERVYDSVTVLSGQSGVVLGNVPGISLDDFRPRFSLGYLAGIGYQISPAVQLDLRATQNVWDNATGSGAMRISRQLYRSPSFQFSLSYRFSQRARIPRAR